MRVSRIHRFSRPVLAASEDNTILWIRAERFASASGSSASGRGRPEENESWPLWSARMPTSTARLWVNYVNVESLDQAK